MRVIHRKGIGDTDGTSARRHFRSDRRKGSVLAAHMEALAALGVGAGAAVPHRSHLSTAPRDAISCLRFALCCSLAPRPLIASLPSETFLKDKWGHVIVDPFLRCLAPPMASASTAVAGSTPATGSGTAPTLAAASPGGTGNAAAAPLGRVLPGVFAMGDCASVSGEHFAATAQVAEQQGTYLARWLNEAAAAGAGRSAAASTAAGTSATTPASGGAGYQAASTAGGPAAAAAASDSAAAGSTATALPAAVEPFSRYQPKGPFEYHHGGSLAFIGGFSAVSDFTQGSAIAPLYGAKLKGWVSFAVWRSAYLTKQGSWRNRMQVPVDWTRTLLFGRDTTAF